MLLKFFLNPASKSYLRGLEAEFGESSNAIRIELNRFEDAGLLESKVEGNKKIFGANITHPLFRPIQKFIHSYIGIDHLVENIILRLGEIHCVYLTGDLAKGKESDIIDLIIVGDEIDKVYLTQLTNKAESFLQRKIRQVNYSIAEWNSQESLSIDELLLIYRR